MKTTYKIFIAGIFTMFMYGSLLSQPQTFGLANGLKTNSINNSNPQLSVSLSSSFTSFAPGFSVFGTTVMPKITFPVSDKFSLQTGIGYSTLFMTGGSESMFSSTPGSYGHVFVSGTYKVNEKLSFRGTGYKTFNLSANPLSSDARTMGYDYSSQGIIMDVEYRVTDNFKINVGFEYREQKSPYFNPNGMYQNTPTMNPGTVFPGFSNHNNLVPF